MGQPTEPAADPAVDEHGVTEEGESAEPIYLGELADEDDELDELRAEVAELRERLDALDGGTAGGGTVIRVETGPTFLSEGARQDALQLDALATQAEQDAEGAGDVEAERATAVAVTLRAAADKAAADVEHARSGSSSDADDADVPAPEAGAEPVAGQPVPGSGNVPAEGEVAEDDGSFTDAVTADNSDPSDNMGTEGGQTPGSSPGGDHEPADEGADVRTPEARPL